MTTDSCKYHPLETATFLCESCEISTCDKCSKEPSTRARNSDYSCFVCGSYLDKVYSDKDFIPFWRRLPEIHLYPLARSGIIAILFIAVATAIAVQVFPLFSIPIFALFFVYCFSCLKSTSRGEQQLPSFSDAISSDVGLAFSLVGIYIVVAFSIGIIFGIFGQGLGIFSLILAVIAIPAIIMLLSIEESFFSALNLAKITRIIWVCGASYGLMFLFILILMGSKELINSIFDGYSVIVVFITSAISNYYTIVIFHLMGYMLYQNSRELDYDVEVQQEVVHRDQDKLLAIEAEILIKEGLYKKGAEKYFEYQQANKQDISTWKKYFQLIIETRNIDAIKKFSESYFEKLISMDDLIGLSQAYLKVRKVDPNFQLKDIKLKFEIALSLYDARHFKSVINLLQNINQATQDKETITKSFSLMAKSYQHIPGHEHKSKVFEQMAAQN